MPGELKVSLPVCTASGILVMPMSDRLPAVLILCLDWPRGAERSRTSGSQVKVNCMPSAKRTSVRSELEQLLEQRILVLDGAMGTTVFAMGIDEAAMRGSRF